MKRMLVLLSMILIGTNVIAQNPPKSPRVEVSAPNVKVSYGQPSKNGRDIFGGLVPYGQVWRTGANKSTDITFEKDATFGGKKVKAGTYALFTIPGEKEWTVILNSQPAQSGAFEYDKTKDKNVVEVKAPVTSRSDVQEKFTISLPKNAIVFEWDKTKVSVPVKF
ncbi:DUF2911 domain-containing protein [Chitinophaga horti]|uniref:DUF2911 domain-containing protein n=1 Tax=Chitinophaga horti TaxID=2920382 RepID=A0ABY6IUZ4_9BACT|nr:DUF2911 domain-containing protein [Chitinophaga horti]UYQ91033.1 DUF2911 domain-containing protein [Chitinophaga horti]